MAAQSVLIAETIAGMKKAIRRRDSSSDSDASIHQPTNRGNKLKRSARYIHEGQLDMANGPRVYKRKIEHAGYQRYILNRNPRRFDADGDELEQDDIDEEADAAAAERNPYHGIKLEALLAPLTSVSELPNHPSLSTPYFSKTLTEMTQQACEMVQREKASLWRMKQLLTKFRGDEIWAPCGHLETENDVALFGHIQMENTEDPVSVRADDMDEPIGQSKIGRTTIQDGDSALQGPVLDGLSFPPRYSPHSHSGAAAIVDERRLREENEKLRATQQSLDPVQTALSALVGGGAADEGMSRPRDHMPHDADSSRDQQGMVFESEGPATKHSIVTGDTSGDNIMSGSPETEKVMLKAEDASTAAPTLLEPIGFSVQTPPIEISAFTTAVEKAGTDSKSNGERKSAEPDPSTVEMVDYNLHPAQSHEESAIVDRPPDTTDPNHPDRPQAEGREREEDGEVPQPAQHRMRTRAQAQAASDNFTTAPTRSPSPASSISTFVHPFFLVPSSAHPDRDFGLPPAEAEDTRRVLMSYVQKQEEVCRGVGKLYEGLLRADRLRKTVLQWCKAEEHVGEMSDGEDWYDKEEWALDEDLKKGHDEEEDEGGNQGKKTRGRRA